MESESVEDYFPKEKILPDGIVEIVFHYEQPFITTNYNGKKIKQPKGFAVSQMKHFIEIESDGKIGFISVRFYPWGAHHFFKTPIKSFIDGTISIKELWPNDYQFVLNELRNLNDEDKVLFIQDFLLKQFDPIKYEIVEAIKLIRNSKGKMTIEEISEQTNISYKQLERNFKATIGVTPKTFSRTTRFLHLCHHLKDYENKSFTEIAFDLGYYDQAHFIKEFKEFSGLTPKEYFEKENICFAEIT